MVGERQFSAFASMSASVYLPEPAGPGQNHRLGKVVARQHVAQAMDDVGIAVKVVDKAHSFASVVGKASWHSAIGSWIQLQRLNAIVAQNLFEIGLNSPALPFFFLDLMSKQTGS